MRVLMISLDRGLLGSTASGDVVERHQSYANMAGALDVIVFASEKHEPKTVSGNLYVFPTKSGKFGHYKKALSVARVLAQKHAYDLLVTQDFATPVGSILKKELGLPWVVSIHGMFFSSIWLKLNPVKWYLLFRVKKAIKSADGFRVNNQDIRNKLLSWGIEKPILVQPTAIDVSRFKSPPHLSSPSRGEESKEGVKILYVGRLSSEKNIGMLIKAVKNLKADVRLQIVGSGPEEAKLKRIAGNGDRIEFLGQKQYEELPAVYAGADIFVLPSNTETFGQVLLQAAASGLAIISTKTNGAQNLIKDGENGLLVDIDSQTDLEEALIKLINDKGLRVKLGEQARSMADKFDANQLIKNLIGFWKEIAKK